MLLGAGVTYLQFEEIAKRAFVSEALGQRDTRGRTVNVSRVAVRTGLSRKEVARVRSFLESSIDDDDAAKVGRPARVLQIWHSEASYQDDQGRPIDLAFEEGHGSFTELVKRVGGDVPAGAVRAELLASGAMIELPNGRLRVQKRYFVPATLDEDLVLGFAFIAAPLLETMSRNVAEPSSALIQRVVYSDHLTLEALETFRSLSRQQTEQLMNSMDAWIGANETSGTRAEDPKNRAGVGVFYFESPRDVSA